MINPPISFSGQALLYGAESNWLNPSDYKTKVVGRLGVDALDDCINNNTQPINCEDNLHTIGKPVRFVARVVYAAAIGILLAPIGAAYHLSKAGYHAIMPKRLGGSWGSAMNHIFAGIDDITHLFFTAGMLATPLMYASSPEKVTVRFHPKLIRSGLAGSLLAKKIQGMIQQDGDILDYMVNVDEQDGWKLKYQNISLINCLTPNVYV